MATARVLVRCQPQIIAENSRSQRGHSTINGHRQLNALLEGLCHVQQGHDIRLSDVLVRMNNVQRRVNVKVPILYFMNDAKEGDMLCCRVAGHSPFTSNHCRTWDVLYEDMLEFGLDSNFHGSVRWRREVAWAL